jgi:hypothetical protein
MFFFLKYFLSRFWAVLGMGSSKIQNKPSVVLEAPREKKK